jgi:hypothetical protein
MLSHASTPQSHPSARAVEIRALPRQGSAYRRYASRPVTAYPKQCAELGGHIIYKSTPPVFAVIGSKVNSHRGYLGIC